MPKPHTTAPGDEENEAKDGKFELVVPGGSTLEAITRGEIDSQIATAHKYPRSMEKFQRRATEMAVMDEETAESCIYVRPVGGGKMAEGLSIRMAEIVGASYGNLRVGATIIEQTERYVVCRGFAHDLETNFASTSEVKEPTVKRDGSPYSEGQRAVVAKACLSKARRDATFQVVPKALCRPIERAARALIAGDAKSMETRRQKAVEYVSRLNIDVARVWAVLGVNGPADLTSDQLVTLTGIRSAIKDGDTTIDDAFPPIIATGKVGAATPSVDPLNDATKGAGTTAKAPEKSEKPKEPEKPSEGTKDQADKLRIALINKAKSANIAKAMVINHLGGQESFEQLGASAVQDLLDNWDDTKSAILAS